MAQPRSDPYVWVTWITGLLSGDSHCQWATWFRAHHTYDKRPSDFDSAKWKAQHAEMVRERVSSLRASGYNVYVEGQNKFTLRGQAATLGGTPDIVALTPNEALVVDCKTGQQRDSDYFQVLTYMLVLPFTHPQARDRVFTGELQYRSASIRIEPSKLSDAEKVLIRSMITRVGGDTPAPKVPSIGECRFCDIDLADCPDRVSDEPPRNTGEHGLF
jgi:hypothetical protein